MRTRLTVFLLAIALPLNAQQQSIFTGDINRTADPCNDFYEYSNGAWRAANPIPESMERWSRRWKAAEENKDQLKLIMDADLALPPQPKGSSAQLIGDFYGACMNTAAINGARLKPIEPLLKRINHVHDAASLNAIFPQLHAVNMDAPFGFGSTPDGLLPQVFVEEDFDFNQRYLGGVSEAKPRWKQCAESADKLLGDPLGKEYVARYFPPEAKTRLHEMAVAILSSMSEVINGLDWMSPETKKRAQEKIASFTINVGYPDVWTDYSSVDIERTDYGRDVLAASRFLAATDDKRIGKPVDRSRWYVTAPTSNAGYNAEMNEILFPAGILQPPGFSLNANDAANYGAIGVVIGHEISHAFDDQGAQFDASGALNDWWTPTDYARFEEKTSCVAHQFDNYFIETGIHHNGKLVLGESIADLAGLKIAYIAFKKRPQGQSKVKIDGFTPEQQFFLAWGQFRGDEIRPAAQRLLAQHDPHPMPKFRVLGPLSNFAPFAQAFGCKQGDAMVRPAEIKCVVW